MYIKEIQIQGFRSIKENLIIRDFGNILGLVWKNNSWKSSVLNAINLFFSAKEPEKADFTYGWNNKIKIKILFQLNNKKDLFRRKHLTISNKQRLSNDLKSQFSRLWEESLSTITKRIMELNL